MSWSLASSVTAAADPVAADGLIPRQACTVERHPVTGWLVSVEASLETGVIGFEIAVDRPTDLFWDLYYWRRGG